ncbi:MAG: type III polyketide synthase [Chlamydiae bacterium]|nr:type III polyketide synthase [Chlamydiota bacterium]MBI3265823.1 type III polyketide synthase [Chlamydiota bacterium]
MISPIYINRISTAVPPYEGHARSIDFLSRFVCSQEDKQKFLAIAKRLGIEKRHTVLQHFFSENGEIPQAFYHSNHFPSTQERMARYKTEAFPLADQALKPILSDGLNEKITHLIITSCTGFYAPGLDIDIVQKLNLNPNIERTFIGYMGCYAAIPGLKLARSMIQGNPHAKVLMVNLELCTLHWRKEGVPFDQLISFLLFADGCAASLISAEPVGIKIEDFYTTVIPESLDKMGWTIGNDGFFMNLHPELPQSLALGLRKEKEKILHNHLLNDFQFWAIHPGGRTILEAIQAELELNKEKMGPSYDVLRNHGNMSSPTVMFILKKFLENSDTRGLGCSMAFGPGLTLESFIFLKR